MVDDCCGFSPKTNNVYLAVETSPHVQCQCAVISAIVQGGLLNNYASF